MSQDTKNVRTHATEQVPVAVRKFVPAESRPPFTPIVEKRSRPITYNLQEEPLFREGSACGRHSLFQEVRHIKSHCREDICQEKVSKLFGT